MNPCQGWSTAYILSETLFLLCTLDHNYCQLLYSIASAPPPSAPTMKLLTKWKVISSVGAKWRELADLLEFDPNITAAIDGKHKGDPDLACREVFTRWLKGEAGTTPTWEELLEALDDGLNFKVFADDLRAKLYA